MQLFNIWFDIESIIVFRNRSKFKTKLALDFELFEKCNCCVSSKFYIAVRVFQFGINALNFRTISLSLSCCNVRSWIGRHTNLDHQLWWLHYSVFFCWPELDLNLYYIIYMFNIIQYMKFIIVICKWYTFYLHPDVLCFSVQCKL